MTELTGRHVFAMFVGGFAIIIGVNLFLAFSAVRTFPGLEVANSYVASQSFQKRRDAQEALGWTVDTSYRQGRLSLSIRDKDGAPAPVRDFTAHVGRPTEARDDRPVVLDDAGSVPVDLAPGLWRLDVAGTAPDGTLFQKAIEISVPR